MGESIYGPWRPYGLSLVIRTSMPPLTLSRAVTSAVGQMDGSIPVDNVITLEDFVGETLTQNKFNMQLLAIFGALAVVLCSVGIYSVLAYSVRRRIRDIGLRLAFGASLADVARLVIMEGMKPTLAGIGIGLLAAIAMGRIVSSQIYGISSRDLATFVCMTALLVVIAFTASLLPALRATRVDPLTVLRDE
jgi:ABC-type antimicrobial peptide transport system permease subunit